MQKIQISFLPTPEPEGEVQATAFDTRATSWEYVIARLHNKRYQYEHKLALYNNGRVLQVLAQDNGGRITEALPHNAFPLMDQTLLLELIDTYGDGAEYKIRITSDRLINPQSTITLRQGRNPQIRIVEVSYMQDTTQTQELNLIGAEDIRPGYAARFVQQPGETVAISSDRNGTLTLQY
jgi:hypothetical protein